MRVLFAKITVASLLLVSSCSHNTKKDAEMPVNAPNTTGSEKDAVSIEAKLAAAQEGASDASEVKFEKNSVNLTEAAFQKLDRAILVASEKSKPTHFTVIAWSDSEMPKPKEPNLPDASIKLADSRAKTIVDYLKERHPGIPTDAINMAEHPGKIQKFLKTDDVRVQQSFVADGSMESKASHAVVLIETRRK